MHHESKTRAEVLSLRSESWMLFYFAPDSLFEKVATERKLFVSINNKFFTFSSNSKYFTKYEVHSISFQTFFVQAFIIAVNSRYFSMLLLYSL